MPCDVFAGFRAMNEHLNPEIYSRLRMTDPWIELVDRTWFPQNSGYQQTVITLNNVEPESVTPAWDAISNVSDTNPDGACAGDFEDVAWGYNERVYAPERKGIKGPIICKDDLTFQFRIDDFIDHYVDQLSYVTRRVWSNRLQEHYMSLSTKYICGADDTVNTVAGTLLPPGQAKATLPAVEATSQLTQDMLNRLAMTLINNGATASQPDAKGYITLGPDGPIFSLMIGMEMSKILPFQTDGATNAQFQAYTSSFMGEGFASELMKKLGATKVLYNFRHIQFMTPPRFNFTGGQYVRVEPFLGSAATGGGRDTKVNPDWVNAPYEAAFILNPLVMRSEVVVPEVNAGNLPFEPANYYGDWMFIDGSYRWDTTCPDPLAKKGRHYAEFKHAIRPIFPEFGYTLIFKRCVNAPLTVGC